MCLTSKQLGALQILAAVVTAVLAYQEQLMLAVMTVAVTFVIIGIHHLTEKKKR
jgi:hypothetical protein